MTIAEGHLGGSHPHHLAASATLRPRATSFCGAVNSSRVLSRASPRSLPCPQRRASENLRLVDAVSFRSAMCLWWAQLGFRRLARGKRLVWQLPLVLVRHAECA